MMSKKLHCNASTKFCINEVEFVLIHMTEPDKEFNMCRMHMKDFCIASILGPDNYSPRDSD